MNEQQYAVQTGGKEIRKDDVVKPKLKRRKSPGAMTWLLSRERSRVPAGSLCLWYVSRLSFLYLTSYTHVHCRHARRGAGYSPAFIYAPLHASGPPWVSSGNLTSSAFYLVLARLLDIASVSGSPLFGPLIPIHPDTFRDCWLCNSAYPRPWYADRKGLRTAGWWITENILSIYGTFCLSKYGGLMASFPWNPSGE